MKVIPSTQRTELKFLNELMSGGYLPPTEDPGSFFERISQSSIRNPLPQIHDGLNYLDNVFPHRFLSKTSGFKSFHESFHSYKDLDKVCRYIVGSGRHPDRELVITNLKFNISMPSHFFPSSATALINHLAPDGDVLDPFLGWGGRALGAFCSKARSFTGTDLQEESVSGCLAISEDFKSLSGVSGDFHHSDFKAFLKGTDRRFDLIVTSPPFADTENYGLKGNFGLLEWTKVILSPLVSLSKGSLKPGGKVAIHGQDRPKLPILSLILSCFLGAGFELREEFKYGKRPGQKILVFSL